MKNKRNKLKDIIETIILVSIFAFITWIIIQGRV